MDSGGGVYELTGCAGWYSFPSGVGSRRVVTFSFARAFCLPLSVVQGTSVACIALSALDTRNRRRKRRMENSFLSGVFEIDIFVSSVVISSSLWTTSPGFRTHRFIAGCGPLCALQARIQGFQVATIEDVVSKC